MWHTIIIVGNLGKNPELRYSPSGQAIANFNLATSRSYTDGKGQKVKETCWFRVSVWGKQAEACNEYLHKGSKVLVEGRLVPDPETGGPKTYARQDGTHGASYDVSAEVVRFIDSKPETEPSGAEARPIFVKGWSDQEEIPF